MSSGVVLLAAGSGRRFGGRIPKQLVSFRGSPLFLKSLRVFARLKSVDEIVVVGLKSRLPFFKKIIEREKIKRPIQVVEGGSFRGDSVRKGILALTKNSPLILIHDSARPFVTAAIIKRVEQGAKKWGAAVAGWPLPDTLKQTTVSGRVLKTIPRKNLWLAQTPQGFKRSVALASLLTPSSSATDDAELVQRRGTTVTLVEGSPMNIKITTLDDFKFARLWTDKGKK